MNKNDREPRASPWAGMNDAVGVYKHVAVRCGRCVQRLLRLCGLIGFTHQVAAPLRCNTIHESFLGLRKLSSSSSYSSSMELSSNFGCCSAALGSSVVSDLPGHGLTRYLSSGQTGTK